MPRVYAKARNNDPTLRFNSREAHFPSGKGYAVDTRIRDYHGAAAQRYAEGVITSFWQSAEEAANEARDVNDGRRFGPGHELHGRVHDAIVVPAWNATDDADGVLPWETPEGSAEMVAAYEYAGVPLPAWLRDILAKLDAEARDVGGPSHREGEPPSPRPAPESGQDAEPDSVDSDTESPVFSDETTATGGVDTRAVTFDDDFVALILDAVRVGEVITTLGIQRPNRIAAVRPEGVRVITDRSDRNGTGPQLVPAWMILTAWEHLQRYGRLTQSELLNDLNVKRSAFACALLSRFPGVLVETSPHVSLRLAADSTADEQESGQQDPDASQTESPIEQPHSHRPGASATFPDTEWWDASTYAARLNHLFDTIHLDGRGPYTPEEVAEQLQADGLPLHVNSITRLRDGLGERPDNRISDAIAFFFNVDAAYLLSGDLADLQDQDERREQAEDPVAQAGTAAHDATPSPVHTAETVPPAPPQNTDVEMSFGQLIVMIAGLSEATKLCVEARSPNEDLARRLAFLVSESTPLLVQALIGDVAVSRRFLERVQDTWGETDPWKNATLPHYRRFRRFLY